MSPPARLSLVTLAVADVAVSTAFYQALGWPLSPASVPGEVSFFNTDGGLLAVWSRQALAADAGVELGEGTGAASFSLAMNLDGPAEVDDACEHFERAGGTILRAPATASWGGYTAYAADPDGHLWEIAFNPDWPIGEDGRPALPRPEPDFDDPLPMAATRLGTPIMARRKDPL